jgi:L-ascorbate metabolism protein UlaG (beta-lactamase superfamily)
MKLASAAVAIAIMLTIQFCWASTEAGSTKLTYLGTAGWEITDGKTVILLDPYYSRLKIPDNSPASKNDPRPVYGEDDFITADAKAIDEHAQKKFDYILVSHTHWDHALDVPAIAIKTDATIIGSGSTANLALISGNEGSTCKAGGFRKPLRGLRVKLKRPVGMQYIRQ